MDYFGFGGTVVDATSGEIAGVVVFVAVVGVLVTWGILRGRPKN